jgi:fatty acid-binding protein DegV
VDYRERTEVFCVLETIENLVKNGRVSKLKAKAAEMMRIFITARGSESGTIEMIGRDRGRDRAYSHLVKRMKKQGKITKILISHCENREGARELSKKLRETFENATIRIQPAGGLCSFYAEAQGLIVAYEKEKKVAVRKD